ncbi:MAG: 30S ribosomal protein S16 [Candidatus Tagabacteria bacterium RIFCSPLOWO2_01_FULL_39_11]|uniref:Small ribosomal subunit protein bS16 n=1 Tax=Candidatus Tagabacteria bacterium RIFCSPLOWO2_01_FULL_39_11 TaxID=1802295 RepID=A0A1G2LQ11_9BACT|nr:MAG: 30S ribosomal protein S16 [Candidatus Tagabacteria bacterium RIFCSPLOWO2_01_FULL_39_11]
MLKIRFQRVGRKHDPNFRVVLTDSRRAAQSGGFLEILGSYSPKQKTTQLKDERIKHWISKGAKISDSVHNILVKKGVIQGPKIKIAIKTGEKSAQKGGQTERKKEEKKEENTGGGTKR